MHQGANVSVHPLGRTTANFSSGWYKEAQGSILKICLSFWNAFCSALFAKQFTKYQMPPGTLVPPPHSRQWVSLYKWKPNTANCQRKHMWYLLPGEWTRSLPLHLVSSSMEPQPLQVEMKAGLSGRWTDPVTAAKKASQNAGTECRIRALCPICPRCSDNHRQDVDRLKHLPNPSKFQEQLNCFYTEGMFYEMKTKDQSGLQYLGQ